MNVSCPECGTVFRVDPAKVPGGGVQARCSVCAGVMSVLSPEDQAEAAAQPKPVDTSPPRPEPAKTKRAAEPPKPALAKSINPFLSRDPGIRAKRLARALISDMVTYYPAKHEEGLREGTLKKLFNDEIKKSYEEYVSQVGTGFAESTSFFQESLNDLLANGKKVF